MGCEEGGGEDGTSRYEEGDGEEDIRKKAGEEENGGEKCSGKRGGEGIGVGRTRRSRRNISAAYQLGSGVFAKLVAEQF
jgi:hypothetical protein